MPQGKEAFFLGGGGKFALESLENIPKVYDFLADLGITTGIKKITDVQANGHSVSRRWTGTDIGEERISGKTIFEAKGTGCLEVERRDSDGGSLVEVYIENGHIRGIVRSIAESKTDPRQVGMNI